MAKNSTCLERRPAFVHVEVGATDVGSGDPHQNVGGLLDFSVRDILDRDVTWAVVHDGFHVELPKVRGGGKAPYPVLVTAEFKVFRTTRHWPDQRR